MSGSLIFRDDIERAGWFAIYASVLGPFLSDKSCVHVEENCEAWADDTVRASRKRSPEQPRVDSLATMLASTSSVDALFPQAGIDLDASGPRVDWRVEFCGERERFTTLAKAVLGPSAWDDLDDYVTPSETLDACLAAVGPRVDVKALHAILRTEEAAADPTKTSGPRRGEAADRARRLRAVLGDTTSNPTAATDDSTEKSITDEDIAELYPETSGGAPTGPGWCYGRPAGHGVNVDMEPVRVGMWRGEVRAHDHYTGQWRALDDFEWGGPCIQGSADAGAGWSVGDWYLTPKGYRGVVVQLVGDDALYGCEEPEWFRTEYGPGDACCAPLSELRKVEGPQGGADAVAWDGSAANWKERALMARRAHEEIAAKLGKFVGEVETSLDAAGLDPIGMSAFDRIRAAIAAAKGGA